MILVWFVYGLAFFVLGLAVLIYPKRGSKFELAGHVWKIGAFGILHGINEWLDMFIAIGGPLPPVPMENARMVTLPGSFMFLLWFGGTAISERFRRLRLVRAVPITLTLAWLALLPVVESQQRLVLGDVLARYLLCAPGALLTAAALFSQVSPFRAMKLRSIALSLTVAACTTVAYGVLAGIVVKRADFFPASVLNYDAFMAATGVPVQIFRALCAIVVACSTIHILGVFRWETQEALRVSELRCATIASTMPVFLFMADRDLVVTFAQGKGLDALGQSPETICGLPVSDLFPASEHFAEDCRRALCSPNLVTMASQSGLTFEICCSALRDRGREPAGIVGVALDISARVVAQKQRDEYRLAMERQARQAAVGALSATLTQQLDEPLSVARLVLDKAVGDVDASGAAPALRNNLAKSLTAVSKAQAILERFAQVAEHDAPKGSQPVGLYQIARRMMEVFAESAAHRGLGIAIKELDVVPIMSVSPRDLEQVFYHVIQSIIDEAEPGRKQSLTIRCAAARDHIDLLFSCVGRAPSGLSLETPADAEDAGLPGLGLAIVKRILDGHGGRMSCVRQADRRTVTVRLPARFPA